VQGKQGPLIEKHAGIVVGRLKRGRYLTNSSGLKRGHVVNGPSVDLWNVSQGLAMASKTTCSGEDGEGTSRIQTIFPETSRELGGGGKPGKNYGQHG